MNDIFEELQPSRRRRLFDFSLGVKKLIVLCLLAALLTFYMVNLFFGQNSVSALFSLMDQRDYLKVEIERLKNQNAMYQKELFELEKLGGDK